MSEIIDIDNEEQILKECDFDYYYNSEECGRELCMFYNDITNQKADFNKRQARIDLGRIGITLNKQTQRIAELEDKVKKTHKFLIVLTDMVFEEDMIAQINWSGANQEICCRYLKELGYVKVDKDNCYVKVYKTFGRN